MEHAKVASVWVGTSSNEFRELEDIDSYAAAAANLATKIAPMEHSAPIKEPHFVQDISSALPASM